VYFHPSNELKLQFEKDDFYGVKKLIFL